MPVSSAEVRLAYRLLLGREAENEDVVARLADVADLAALRRVFVDSAEFRTKHADALASPGASRGRYMDAPAPRVELATTPAQMQAMLDRIAAAWAAFGETEPHWSVLVSDTFRAENIAANIDDFYRSGEEQVGGLLAMAARAGIVARPGARLLDFGCGVGRLTLALAARDATVTGVDISPGHLKLARERAAATGVANVAFERIAAVADLARWAGAIDLLISCIVLQHNPPPVMAAILGRLLDMLAPGGAAIVQLPTYIEGQDFVVADYLANAQPQMEMNALPQREVFAIVARHGCQVREVREDGAIGDVPGVSQTFVVQRA